MTNKNNGIALIIGGSTGMGFEIAKRLALQGPVHVVARATERLENAARELEAAGGSVQTTGVDLADQDEVARFVESLERSDRPIRYLVNAAGYFKPTPFLEHTHSDYDTYHDFNRATFFITQAVAKNMKAAGGGAIVNIGSMWAKQAIKATPSSAYSMAKAGLHSLTQHLAMELAQDGIRVNEVSPAVVVTPIYGAFIEPSKIEEELQGFNDFHPIGRVG